jgi:hypothetical protein
MVIVPHNTDVVSLSGHPAEVVLDVQAGRKVNSLEPVLRNLADLGVITTPGVSRRGLITAGAVGAGAGIAVLAMPGVAAASSVSIPSDDDSPLPEQFYLLDGGIFFEDNQYRFVISPVLMSWPDPQPSTNISDVSALEISGFPPLSVLPGDSEVADEELFFRGLVWGSLTEDPGTDVEGIFSWTGSDRRFKVTFQPLPV